MRTPVGKLFNIAIFASGGGTNAQKIIDFTENEDWGAVRLVVADNPRAGVKDRAAKHGIPYRVLNKAQRDSGDYILELMEEFGIDLIVLAGYLKLVPAKVVRAFKDRMLNIHPSLLPAFGGKGMYGKRVHEAVIAEGVKVSGITIHYVNEQYDQGQIIRQLPLEVQPDWSAETLSHEIQKLEWRHFPQVVKEVCLNLKRKKDRKD